MKKTNKPNQKIRVLKAWEIIPNPTQNGFLLPKKVKCFKCSKEFFIKFVIPQQDYSKKNNWYYWTRTGKDEKICDNCLLKFYYNKPLYWNLVKDLKKRQQMRTYIYHGVIKKDN